MVQGSAAKRRGNQTSKSTFPSILSEGPAKRGPESKDDRPLDPASVLPERFVVMLSLWGLVNVVANTFGLQGAYAPPLPTSFSTY